jgi:cytochrome c oxidase subunit 4
MRAIYIRLLGVWAALLGLLVLTVAGSFALHGASSLVLSLGVAFAKAALIFWFFMQLRTEGGLTRIAAIGAAVWLLVLLWLLSVDYVSR